MRDAGDLPEREEVLDLLFSGGLGDVLNVNGRSRHFDLDMGLWLCL